MGRKIETKWNPDRYFSQEYHVIWSRFIKKFEIKKPDIAEDGDPINLYLERVYEDLISRLSDRTPFDVFNFTIKTKEYISAYSLWHTDQANSFFEEVCSSSLINHLSSKEIKEIRTITPRVTRMR